MPSTQCETANQAEKPSRRNTQNNFTNSVFFIACISFATYLVELAYEGFFTRFIADDFCYVNPAIKHGHLQGFWDIYTSWSGRYSAIFFTQLGSITGRFFPSILPILLIFGLSISLNYCYQQLFLLFSISESKRFAILPALASLFFFLLMTPNRYQVLDWVNGSVTYSGPLILMVALIAWLIRIIRKPDLKKPWLNGIGIGLLAFVGAGFSETNTALLISSLSILILLSLTYIKKEKKWRAIRWQLIALAGTLSGLVMMIIAPGNEVRKGALNLVAPKIPEMVITSARYAWDFSVDTLKTKPLPVVILVGLFIMIGFISLQKGSQDNPAKITRSDSLPFVLIPIITFVVILSVVAPSVYFQSAYPADRALSGAMFIFVLSTGMFGIFLGKLLKLLTGRLKSQWLNVLQICFILGVMLASIYPIRATLLNIPDIQATIQFGKAWDSRHVMIMESISDQQLDLIVPDINSQHGLKDVNEDPALWVNQCMAEYYGLSSIRTGK